MGLPRYVGGIIGRRVELDAIKHAIDGGARIITLLGLGGMGKTRLACAFADSHAGDRTVLYCDVANGRSSADLCAVLARALDLRADEPGDTLAERIGHVLASRGPTLVVVDNFEQLARDAARPIHAWGAEAPRAVFVITSRRPIDVEGEHMIALGPLGVEAEELFALRARSRVHGTLTDADAPVVARVVRRLDGLPLAIELAAARLDVLPLRALAERLDERFALLRDPSAPDERHGTLLRALEWSWDLLSPALRTALGRLSVFEGPFTLEDAAAVLAPAGEAALDTIHALVKNSVVHVTSDDFVLLDTVREFAAQKLEDVEETQRRHAHLFLGRASSSERDRDDLMAVLRRALERGDSDEAMRTLVALETVLAMRTPANERLALIDRVLAISPDDSALRLSVVHARAVALLQLGGADEALDMLERALASARALELPRDEAKLLELAAMCHGSRGRPKLARARAMEAAAIWAKLGDARGEASALFRLSWMEMELGDFEPAAAHASRALALFESVGDQAGVIRASIAVGAQAAEKGDLALAQPPLERAVEAARAAGDRVQEAVAVGLLGDLAHEREEWDGALELRETARAMFEASAFRRLEAIYLGYVGIVKAQRGDLDGGDVYIEKARARLATMGDPRYTANMEAALVGTRALRGDTAGAREALERIRANVTGKGSARLPEFVEVYLGVLDALEGDVESAERRADVGARGVVEARLAMPFLRRAIGDAKDRARAWAFDGSGVEFQAPGSTPVSLSTHAPLARIVAALVRARIDRPAEAVDKSALIAAGWPDETGIAPASAQNRLKVAVSTLRKTGLTLLLTRDSHYLLDPDVPVRLYRRSC